MSGQISYAEFQRKAQERRATEELLRADIDAALHNEQVTRKRIENLETWARRGFLGRWKWLLLGK